MRASDPEGRKERGKGRAKKNGKRSGNWEAKQAGKSIGQSPCREGLGIQLDGFLGLFVQPFSLFLSRPRPFN